MKGFFLNSVNDLQLPNNITFERVSKKKLLYKDNQCKYEQLCLLVYKTREVSKNKHKLELI
ncbi:hypothetical protein CW731_01335 [Polaribacter sp. ALD11]|nr:hypothetical protein CW731_01335 [Polaribacter sp. ALD11]